jgi:hypothetical protein
MRAGKLEVIKDRGRVSILARSIVALLNEGFA